MCIDDYLQKMYLYKNQLRHFFWNTKNLYMIAYTKVLNTSDGCYEVGREGYFSNG